MRLTCSSYTTAGDDAIGPRYDRSLQSVDDRGMEIVGGVCIDLVDAWWKRVEENICCVEGATSQIECRGWFLFLAYHVHCLVLHASYHRSPRDRAVELHSLTCIPGQTSQFVIVIARL